MPVNLSIKTPEPLDIGDQLARSDGMKEKVFTIPEIGLIAGTRVALGVGIGLLMADKLNKDQRRGAGWAMFGIGAATSIPLLFGVFGNNRTIGFDLLKKIAA